VAGRAGGDGGARDGNNPTALLNLAAITMESSPETALRHLHQAEKAAPRDVAVQINLGAALMTLARLPEARAHFARALELAPGHVVARNNLAHVDLALGRFGVETWDAYRARWMHESFTGRHALPGLRYLDALELPAPGQGRERLLVHLEQGLGDEIFFAGCLGEMRRHTSALAISCEPRLARLFAQAFPGIEVIARELGWEERARAFAADAQVYAGDLPYWLRRSSASFPAPRAYLHADAARAAHWRERLHALDTDGVPTLKIGISWRGGMPASGRASRSVPMWEWAPLFSLPGISWIDLQYGEHQAELHAAQGAGVPLTRFEDALADYDETAALVRGLDLVVSVTTAVVDLAGALDVPCWVLVPRKPIWKFGAAGERTPWYGSLRLFRQGAQEKWSAPMARLTAALESAPAVRSARLAQRRGQLLAQMQ
jgi:tetratricopeptide (TPR) repeat protein